MDHAQSGCEMIAYLKAVSASERKNVVGLDVNVYGTVRRSRVEFVRTKIWSMCKQSLSSRGIGSVGNVPKLEDLHMLRYRHSRPCAFGKRGVSETIFSRRK